MEKKGITPIQIIQELIAILSIRKEACERILAKPGATEVADEIKRYSVQTEKNITDLQNELAEFGDAVMADVDRTNAYHKMWKQALVNEEASSANDLRDTFFKMEKTLKQLYADYRESGINLPESLSELLAKQAEDLNKV